MKYYNISQSFILVRRLNLFERHSIWLLKGFILSMFISCVEVDRVFDSPTPAKEKIEGKLLEGISSNGGEFYNLSWLDTAKILLVGYDYFKIYDINTKEVKRVNTETGYINHAQGDVKRDKIWFTTSVMEGDYFFDYLFEIPLNENHSTSVTKMFPVASSFYVSSKYIAYNNYSEDLSYTDSLFIYDIDEETHRFIDNGIPMGFSPNGQFLAIKKINSSSTIKIVDIQTNNSVAENNISLTQYSHLIWENNEPYLIVREESSGNIERYDLLTESKEAFFVQIETPIEYLNNQGLKHLSSDSNGSFAFTYDRYIFNRFMINEVDKIYSEIIWYNHINSDTTTIVRDNLAGFEALLVSPDGRKVLYNLLGQFYLQQISF